MTSIIVYHEGYGCDTGCCGHVIEVDGQDVGFGFSHPDDGDDLRKFAEDLIREQLGDDHVADLDWENSRIDAQ